MQQQEICVGMGGGQRTEDSCRRSEVGGRRSPQLNTLAGNPVQRGREVRGQQGKRRYPGRVVGGEVKQGQDGWMNGCVDGKKQRDPCRVVGGEVAEDLFDRGLCLPSGTAMTNSDLDRVIETILKCRK